MSVDDRDVELFLEMLNRLNETHSSIKAASKWCRANAASHERIVRMWFFAVAKAVTPRQRLHLFHLASDILFTADSTSIQYFSSFLPQLVKAVPFLRGDEIHKDIKKLFNIWRDKKIYNKVVMKWLNKSLMNRNKAVDPAIFKYDKDLLFKNLKRVEDLNPACEYLSRGIDFSPSFNSQALMSTVKERRVCQSLLASVDSHKSRMTSLVSYMEEMVHLLKMATTTLDLAGNKEQNGVDETNVRILAYGRCENKIKDVLGALEKKFGFTRKDYAKPGTPAGPEPDEGTLALYSRRVGIVGVPGDPRMASPAMVPAVAEAPLTLPAVPPVPVVPTVITSWSGAPKLLPGEPDDIFTRRNRANPVTPRRDNIAFTNPAPPPWADFVTHGQDYIAFTNPAPPPRAGSVTRRQGVLAFTNPAPPLLPTDDLPFACPRLPLPREPFPYDSARVVGDDIPFVSSMQNMTLTRNSPSRISGSQRAMTSLLNETPEIPRLLEEPWGTPRQRMPKDEPQSPRVHEQELPWDTPWPRKCQDETWGTPWQRMPKDEPQSPRVHEQELPWDTPWPRKCQDETWDTPRPHARDTLRPGRFQGENWGTPRPHARDNPWSIRPHTARGESLRAPRQQRAGDKSWPTRPRTAKRELFDTPRPHSSTEEPWERSPNRGVTLTRTPKQQRARDEPRSSRPHTPGGLNTPRRQRTRHDPWSPRPDAAREVLNTVRRRRTRDDPSPPRPYTARGESFGTPRQQRARRDKSWPTRPRTAKGVLFDTPRPQSSTEEPWERSPNRGVTLTRNNSGERTHKSTPARHEPWSPISPSYTGTWGPPLKQPVYVPCFTGFHLESLEKQSMPPPSYKTPYDRYQPTQRPPSRPSTPGNSQSPLLADPPQPSLLGDGPQPEPLSGTRPSRLPTPKAASKPSLKSLRGERKKRR